MEQPVKVAVAGCGWDVGWEAAFQREGEGEIYRRGFTD